MGESPERTDEQSLAPEPSLAAQGETWLAKEPPRSSQAPASRPSELVTNVAEARTQPLGKPPPSFIDEPATVGRLSPRQSTHDTRPEGADTSWEEAHLPPLPNKIGRFEIKGRLGAGGMGMVFEGHDTTLDRQVAVKLLRLDESGSQSDEASARLLREAQALARLSHPNVIQVYEVGTWREQVFVAMEFVDGVTFERWQSDPDLPWVEVLRAYIQAGRGLVAAHDAGIVHRDFKPSNVMRGRDGRVVVLDFGLARDTLSADQSGAREVLDAEASGSFESRITKRRARASASSSAWRRTINDAMGTPLTATGAVMGTPAYMAPEQHEGILSDSRTDQFAFCVSLYEALYGERPFEGGSLAMLASAVIEGRVRAAPEYTQVPVWAREVLLRGLAVDPAARYPSMQELLAELDRVPQRTPRTLKWVAGAAMLALVALLAWAQWRRPALDVEATAQRFRNALARADTLGHELDAEGHGTPASQHWDALVLAHARETMSRDPSEALATLQHLTPGDPHWVPAARMIAAEARDRGVAWRAYKFGALEEVQITTLGDVVLALDAAGRVHRWRLDGDAHDQVGVGEAAVVAMALGATGRLALLADAAGGVWELELGAQGLRPTPTPLQTQCETPRLRVDRDAKRALLLCQGRWRRLRSEGSGWTDFPTPSLAGKILDAALTDAGALLLVAPSSGGSPELLHVADEAAAEPEVRGVIDGAFALQTHPGATDDHVYVRTRAGVFDTSSNKLVRRIGPQVPAARGAAGLVWVDDAELVVEHGLEGRRLVGHSGSVKLLAAAPTQAVVLSVDETGDARAWRTRRGGGRLLRTGGGGVEALDLDAAGGVLFTGSRDGRVRRRDLLRRSLVELGKQPGAVRRLVASPGGEAVATVGEAAGVRVWDRDGGDPKMFAKAQQPARVLAWTNAGDRVAAGACTTGEACGVHLFEVARGREVELQGPTRAPQRIAFSSDDTHIAALEAREDGAQIWLASLADFESQRMERADGDFGRVENMAFEGPEHLWVAWAEFDDVETLRLWQVDARGHAAEITVLGGVGERFADGPWLGWRRAGSMALLDLRESRVHQIFEVEGPISGLRVRRGGGGVALFDSAEGPTSSDDGALLVDFASHERRRVSFGEGPHVWGQAIVDAPGNYLRVYDDASPQSPEELARWILAESTLWVDPASMHRSHKMTPDDRHDQVPLQKATP